MTKILLMIKSMFRKQPWRAKIIKNGSSKHSYFYKILSNLLLKLAKNKKRKKSRIEDCIEMQLKIVSCGILFKSKKEVLLIYKQLFNFFVRFYV